MGRQSRTGIDFFSMDTDFFSDRKVKSLRARFGGDGIAFFMYVLCEIYRDKGYYLITDDEFEDNAAADLGVSSDKIGLMLHFLLNKSLLDSTLFSTDKVLSSHGIQLRFQKAVKARALKTPISVDLKLWLLSEEETSSFIQVQKNDDYSEKKADFSEKNSDNSEKNDTNETKRNEKKRDETKRSRACFGEFENVLLTATEYGKLQERFGNSETDRAVGELSAYCKSRGKKYDDYYAALLNWMKSEIFKSTAPKTQKYEYDYGDTRDSL